MQLINADAVKQRLIAFKQRLIAFKQRLSSEIYEKFKQQVMNKRKDDAK